MSVITSMFQSILSLHTIFFSFCKPPYFLLQFLLLKKKSTKVQTLDAIQLNCINIQIERWFIITVFYLICYEKIIKSILHHKKDSYADSTNRIVIELVLHPQSFVAQIVMQLHSKHLPAHYTFDSHVLERMLSSKCHNQAGKKSASRIS